jgi:D-3-phosphoglycerate dehydrogenase
VFVRSRPVILKPFGSVDWEIDAFGHLAEVRLVPCSTEEDLVDAIRDVDILIADVDIKVTAKVIEAARCLRGILCASMGTDYVDVDAASRKGIRIANLPDFAVNAVSEHALLLMLMVARKIGSLSRHKLNEQWENRRLFQGFELEGKTLGIIGLGKTGQNVARKAFGLGMKVLAYSPHANPKRAAELGVSLVKLEEVLNLADVLTVHTSLRPDTKGLIGREQLKLMKPSAILVNVARGGIVDEEALYEALTKGWIAGAGLDVLSEEPPRANHPLLQLENVVYTPHMAFNTVEAKKRSRAMIVDEMTRLINGVEPRSFVNRDLISSNS